MKELIMMELYKSRSNLKVIQPISKRMLLCECCSCGREFEIPKKIFTYINSCGCEYGEILNSKIDGIFADIKTKSYIPKLVYNGTTYELYKTKNKAFAYSVLLKAKSELKNGTFEEWYTEFKKIF